MDVIIGEPEVIGVRTPQFHEPIYERLIFGIATVIFVTCIAKPYVIGHIPDNASNPRELEFKNLFIIALVDQHVLANSP
jgi:hypothetical protein